MNRPASLPVSAATRRRRHVVHWLAVMAWVVLATPAAVASIILDTAFNPGANNGVQTFAQQADGKLLVGGGFTQIAGVSRAHLARLHTDGTLDLSFGQTSAVNGWIYSIVANPDGTILIGGRFTTVGNTARPGIARLLADGSVDLSFVPPPVTAHTDGSNVFRLLRQADGRILVGGHFADIGQSGRAKIARLNANGSLDTSFPAVVFGSSNNYIWSLARQADGKILIGGNFLQVNGTARTNLARLDSSGHLDPLFAAGIQIRANTNGSTSTIIVQPDQRIIVVGNFNEVIGTGGSPQFTRNVVRFDVDGSIDASFSRGTASTSATVHWASLQADGKLLIGGHFTQVSTLSSPAISRSRLARLNSDGSVDLDFDPPTINGTVWSLLTQSDGRIAIGGIFTDVAGTARGRIARLIELAPMTHVRSISTGGLHTCALTQRGAVQCWGNNEEGQLGDGGLSDRYMPSQVFGLSSGIRAISSGYWHTCALTDTGAVKCWGRNHNGALGDGTTNRRLVPVDVIGLSVGVTKISAGGDHTCALTQAGALKCWGFNSVGQLGDGSQTNRLTPTDVVGLSGGVLDISTGNGHNCAKTAAGAAKCWGHNRLGQLGDGSTTNRLTPADVVGMPSGVEVIRAGGSHSCAITVTGITKCWGSNSYGQLGNGTTMDSMVPVDVPGLAAGAQTLSAGFHNHNCAVTIAGGAKCWGQGSSGRLGDGTQIDRPEPVDVVNLSADVQMIRAGGFHTCALTRSGAVKCWGGNFFGELGDGTYMPRLTPVDVLAPIQPGSDRIFGNGFENY